MNSLLCLLVLNISDHVLEIRTAKTLKFDFLKKYGYLNLLKGAKSCQKT
jgi:hypothetical protein